MIYLVLMGVLLTVGVTELKIWTRNRNMPPITQSHSERSYVHGRENLHD